MCIQVHPQPKQIYKYTTLTEHHYYGANAKERSRILRRNAFIYNEKEEEKSQKKGKLHTANVAKKDK